MNPPTTNWTPGLIVLAVGFVAAALFLLLNRSKGTPAQQPRDGAIEDLERRYQSLIEQLKELAAEKHTLPAERYQEERTRLELAAAAALRAKDEHLKKGGVKQPSRQAPASPGVLSPQLTGALWGAGIVLFFGLLGYLLVSEQRTRDEGMEATGRLPPGQSGMGQQQQQDPGQQTPPQEDPQYTEALERLRANPSDLEASGFVGHEMIRSRQLDDAERITKKALAVDPFHIESRVHLGVLHAIRGDGTGAEQELLELADTYPGAQEALLFLGFINLQSGNRPKALEFFERFTVEVPRDQQPPGLDAAIAQLRQEVGGAP